MREHENGSYNVDEMVEKIYDYVDTCVSKKKPPIIKQLTTKYHWNYQYAVVNLPARLREKGDTRLYDAYQYLLDTKEWMLERLGLEGKIDKTICVFSLKQLGWRDNQDIVVGQNDDNNFRIVLQVAE